VAEFLSKVHRETKDHENPNLGFSFQGSFSPRGEAYSAMSCSLIFRQHPEENVLHLAVLRRDAPLHMTGVGMRACTAQS
jgi:hypothetical protein